MNLDLKILTIIAFSLKIINVWHEEFQIKTWFFEKKFVSFLQISFHFFYVTRSKIYHNPHVVTSQNNKNVEVLLEKKEIES